MPDRTYLVRGLNDTSTAAYYQLMVKSAKLLGANEDIVEKELLKALHFEMALANVSDFRCKHLLKHPFSQLLYPLTQYDAVKLKEGLNFL